MLIIFINYIIKYMLQNISSKEKWHFIKFIERNMSLQTYFILFLFSPAEFCFCVQTISMSYIKIKNKNALPCLLSFQLNQNFFFKIFRYFWIQKNLQWSFLSLKHWLSYVRICFSEFCLCLFLSTLLFVQKDYVTKICRIYISKYIINWKTTTTKKS